MGRVGSQASWRSGCKWTPLAPSTPATFAASWLALNLLAVTILSAQAVAARLSIAIVSHSLWHMGYFSPAICTALIAAAPLFRQFLRITMLLAAQRLLHRTLLVCLRVVLRNVGCRATYSASSATTTC